jgi:hypothetical protein
MERENLQSVFVGQYLVPFLRTSASIQGRTPDQVGTRTTVPALRPSIASLFAGIALLNHQQGLDLTSEIGVMNEAMRHRVETMIAQGEWLEMRKAEGGRT